MLICILLYIVDDFLWEVFGIYFILSFLIVFLFFVWLVLILCVIKSTAIYRVNQSVADITAVDIPSIFIFLINHVLHKLPPKFNVGFSISAIYFVLSGALIKLYFDYDIKIFVADIVYLSIFLLFAGVSFIPHLIGRSNVSPIKVAIFDFMPVCNLLFGIILLGVDTDFVRVKFVYVLISCLMILGIVGCVFVSMFAKRKMR